MEWLLLIIGILLVGMAYLDLLQTTIEHTGAGFLSSRLGAALWKFILTFSRKRVFRGLLNISGLIIVSCLILYWILSIWIGFTFIFSIQQDSIVKTVTDAPSTIMEKFYYVGYTLSTLGIGDFNATSNIWRILSVIVSISGLLIITLAITYLIPLLDAVLNKRKICAYISFLGRDPEEIIIKGWNGSDLSRLDQQFEKLGWEILDLKEKHLLYPVLHYFHSKEKRFVSPIMFSILDEAISMILGSPHLKQRINITNLLILRSALDEYLETLEGTYIYSSEETPPIPNFERLNELLNIDTKPIHNYFQENESRRKLLNGMIEADGWRWEEIREDV